MPLQYTKLRRYILTFSSFISFNIGFSQNTSSENFNLGWEFVKDADTSINNSLFQKGNTAALPWEKISLPHTAQIEPLIITGKQWQGFCFYRKFFVIPQNAADKNVSLYFEGAMQVADIYLNGEKLQTHNGGYLPFTINISNKIKPGKEYCVLVRLNNQDNPQVPPGKPYSDLDFCYYSGIYRNVWLQIKNKIRISDAVEANKIAGGGIFVRFKDVTKTSAIVMVKTDVQNDFTKSANVKAEITLTDKTGLQVAKCESGLINLQAGGSDTLSAEMKVNKPILWNTDNPYLYKLTVKIISDNKEQDQEKLNIGIRTFSFVPGKFTLNGEVVKLRGTNRHQEYPYIGNALSDNAQYRDAYKIKQAGFNFVRLSHYPQSSPFMNACDELGILVMNSIPGWQFFGDQEFQKNSIQTIRDLIHRDRNHPCVIMWEASLNESRMETSYMEKAHNTVKEELPQTENYTCGWLDKVYDIYIPARQHAKPPYYWNKYAKNKPLFIAEYGDWEYYAQNAGFSQKEFSDLKEGERNSRQLRGDGQIRLSQQALNFQESHNDNLNGPAVGDANWLMYDYNRGYAPDIESSGIMDIFRLPKFSFYFFKSQSNILENSEFNKPMAFVANYWNDPNYKDVKVYSNCEEVELWLNGKAVARQKPDTGKISNNLTHAPFTFTMPSYSQGKLIAKGLIKGKAVIQYAAATPSDASGIKLLADISGKEISTNDVVFVYAYITDKDGNTVPADTRKITLTIESGDASIVATNSINAEAGIASFLLKTGNKPGNIKLKAIGDGLTEGSLQITTK
jgi:beta-galactosidase